VVHLLRHGEVRNPDKILYGRLPGYRLSDLGERMAVQAGDYLAERDVAAVISSPMERAQQTAAPLADKLHLPVTIDERLIEAANQFEGQPFGVGDGALRRPAAWRHLYNPFLPSWGEHYTDLADRMRTAILAARNTVPGREAVLVSHQLPIWIARLSAERRPLWHDPRRRECTLASVTSFHFLGSSLTGVTYAEPCADLLPGAGAVSGA
jgi:broad specificity phosphatase PhoE